MYKKILLPLDGSPNSECILAHVKEIASGCKVPEVVALFVVEPIRASQTFDIPEGYLEEARNKNLAQAEDYVSGIADNLKKNGISATAEVIQGKAADSILDYARDNEVDLILISTHGRSGVSRWALGSVADRVIRQSLVPVLSVAPPGCRLSDSRVQ